ncbi:MAG: uracil-DNA glycosylase [Phycisphaerales bacterium]|nr:uracil-DNA glycosylase [Phycisphaerales bacterium]
MVKKNQKPLLGSDILLARADVAMDIPCMPVPKHAGLKKDGDSLTDFHDCHPMPSTLEALEAMVTSQFPFCESLSGATRCVFGEGNPDAELVFVGEAPSSDEDRLGRPFMGAAGRKLDEIIDAMGFSRESVYICNVLKAHPPENRRPLPEEVQLAAPWLYAQLRLIRPKVIVALGGPAAQLLLSTETGIMQLRGQMAEWRDPGSSLVIAVVPTFHPAYLLRNYTKQVRGQMWEDMQAAVRALERG